MTFRSTEKEGNDHIKFLPGGAGGVGSEDSCLDGVWGEGVGAWGEVWLELVAWGSSFNPKKIMAYKRKTSYSRRPYPKRRKTALARDRRGGRDGLPPCSRVEGKSQVNLPQMPPLQGGICMGVK